MSVLPRFIDDVGTNRPYADDASGTLELRSECCCDDCTYSETDCANCTAGQTPAGFAAVFSGVTHAASCFGCSLVGSAENVSSSLNGTHTLTQTASACVWEKVIANDVTWDEWSNSDCTGTSSSKTADLIIRLTRNAADWTLEAGPESATASGVIAWRLYLDTISETAANDCDTIGSSTNDYAAYACNRILPAGTSTITNLGKDGSATLTCN